MYILFWGTHFKSDTSALAFTLHVQTEDLMAYCKKDKKRIFEPDSAQARCAREQWAEI